MALRSMRKGICVTVFLILLFALLFFIHYTSLNQVVYIRTFDLGGSGLKTALLSYDKNSRVMSWVELEAQLEKCPIELDVADWIRSHMKEVTGKDLDEEIRSGYLFGFSLSGLYKLRRTRSIRAMYPFFSSFQRTKFGALMMGLPI